MTTKDYENGAAYVYGQYVPMEDAAIPVLDMGFFHCDVCYDVTSTWNGNIFRLKDHFKRFRNTLKGFHMELEQDDAAITEVMMECVRLTGLKNTYLYFGATRGFPKTGKWSRDHKDYVCQLLVFAIDYVYIIDEEIMNGRGAHLYVCKKARRTPPESINPRFKNHAWVDLNSGLIEAQEAGADQAALLDYDGNLTEGPGFNLFIVKDGKVITPDQGVLEGITRMSVFELCEEMGIPVEVRTVKENEIYTADEMFLSTTAGGIAPFSRVDNHIMSGDKPGPISVKIKNLYWKKREEGWHATPVIYR